MICYHVLEHVPDDASAMAEIARVLRPGGVAIVQVPHRPGVPTDEDPSAGREERIRRFGQADHVRYYGDDFEPRLEKAGLEVNRLQTDMVPEDLRELFRLAAYEPVWLVHPAGAPAPVTPDDDRGQPGGGAAGGHAPDGRPTPRPAPRAGGAEGRRGALAAHVLASCGAAAGAGAAPGEPGAAPAARVAAAADACLTPAPAAAHRAIRQARRDDPSHASGSSPAAAAARGRRRARRAAGCCGPGSLDREYYETQAGRVVRLGRRRRPPLPAAPAAAPGSRRTRSTSRSG